jgi:hypothetical protein
MKFFEFCEILKKIEKIHKYLEKTELIKEYIEKYPR